MYCRFEAMNKVRIISNDDGGDFWMGLHGVEKIKRDMESEITFMFGLSLGLL